MKTIDLVKVSSDILTSVEAEVGETIGLGILDLDSLTGIVVAKALGTSGFAFHLDVDYHFPLHTSAPGKVFLAYIPEKEQKDILDKLDFISHTPSTITDAAEFKAEIDNALLEGYSYDVGEQILGCHCVGVPIFKTNTQEVIAAIWATGPSSMLPVRSFRKIATILQQGAEKISKRLLYSTRSSDREYINTVVLKAQKILNKHIDVTFNMAELAKQLNVGYSWFRKVFKQQTGLAPSEYHKRQRMKKAQSLLIETDLTISEISKVVGFKNQNHFSATFKKFSKQSPKYFRK